MSQISELHRIELNTLKKFVNICEKHHIKYFLIGGSLLGAIRHNGFIPWDDDVDIGMRRDEYDRFSSIAPALLQNEHYFIQTADTDPNFAFSYMKMIDTDTYIEERNNVNDARKGVFVDIFPFDKVPRQPEIRRAVYSRSRYFDTRILLRLGYNIIKTPFRKDPETNDLNHYMSVAKLKEKRENIMRLYNMEPFHHYKNYASQYAYDKEVLNQAEISELITHPFEDIQVKIPEAYDRILTRMYDDYMTLPPERDQKEKHVDVLIVNGKQID